MKNRWIALVLCSLLTTFILGCGSSTKTPTVSGVFADAPVMGLSYSCGSKTGTTGTGGAFSCAPKTTVTFTIGGITICSAPAQPFMTPVSCAQANGNATADASTPSVVATAQFVISVGTPNGTAPGSLSSLTITSAELTAAQNLSLDFTTATQTQLQTALTTVNPGQTLASPTTAQTELTSTINTNTAGTYSGTYSGGDTGTWMLTIDSSGNVSGSFSSTGGKGNGTITGALAFGTTFTGTAGSAAWSGTVNTSAFPTSGKGPFLFSGTWNNTVGGISGSFTN